MVSTTVSDGVSVGITDASIGVTPTPTAFSGDSGVSSDESSPTGCESTDVSCV